MHLQSCVASIWRFPYRLAGVVVIFVGVYAGSAFGLYALMQPTVVANPGLSAYQPPPGTIVTYAGLPVGASAAPKAAAAAAEPHSAVAVTEPAPQPVESRVAEPKKETKKKQATRTAPRREHAGQDAARHYASSRSQGFFRPWF
jgi:hypothetical protein